jgi:hypothetical protein
MIDAIVDATHIQNVLIYNETKVRVAFRYSSMAFGLLQGLEIPPMMEASQDDWQESAPESCVHAGSNFLPKRAHPVTTRQPRGTGCNKVEN